MYRQNVLGFHSFQNTLQGLLPRDILIGVVVIPSIWLFIYLLSGTYFDLYHKSRLIEINRIFIATLLGGLFISLFFFSNDNDQFKYFIKVTARYMLLHFSILCVFRFVLFQQVKKNILTGVVHFKTVIIGGNSNAVKLYQTIQEENNQDGNLCIGFISLQEDEEDDLVKFLPKLGNLNNLESVIEQNEIEVVIISMDTSEHHLLSNILIRLSHTPLFIKVLPDLYDFISGVVKTTSINAAALINIYPDLMPDWQRVCKRFMDIIVSASAIIILLPLYLFTIIRVKFSSAGPILYKQERIGKYGIPFNILKFRSMYVNAEEMGPALSKTDDPRITNWGKFMRKWRIDELPQFFNILRGDMSLVGPRPERIFYINQITTTHPHYKYLHKVKPGLTSWGMVQYGYAENLDQMIDRMKYDILYIENCSLALDIKIMLYTFKVLFQGRGK
jgi:exopolysaccharide biosynthesis polyprenyl glycosylphosphotransferase